MFCDKTKEFLSQKGIRFEERDVTKDSAAFEELRRLKAMTTPVTVVDGNVIVGFDTEKLGKALGTCHQSLGSPGIDPSGS